MKHVGELSNRELLAGVQASFGEERRWVARVVAYLAEIERRRIHLEAAYSSLFDFCRRRLGMSDGEAFRRSTAARLVQRFPSILDALDRGDVHLSALVLLRDHLTNANHEKLVRAASGKTKLEVQEMIATLFPKPDVPSRIAELPPKMPPQAELALAVRRRRHGRPRRRTSRAHASSRSRPRATASSSRHPRSCATSSNAPGT